MLELILGGARSGKSRLAEKLADESGLEVVDIATSQPLDGEMNARVARRTGRWSRSRWRWPVCCANRLRPVVACWWTA